MTENIYCGISKVPKGYRLGTATECLNKGQVRYYGLELVQTTKTTKSIESQFKTLNDKLLMIKLKAKTLKENTTYEKNEKETIKLWKRYDKLKQKYDAEFVVYKELENQLAKS